MSRYLFILIVFCSVEGFGQQSDLSETIKNIAEELASDEDDPEAATLYIEKLNELAENPVKINSHSLSELSRLFFLSDFQVKALDDYVKNSGQILSLYELDIIPGFNRETAMMMAPFITLGYKLVNSRDSTKLYNSLLTNFSLKPGKKDTSDLGSPWKIQSRYKFNAGAFSGGVTIEKDPGEKFLYGNPVRPDFLSANISYSGTGILKKLIAGDFSARFGLGTNINTGIRRGFSPLSPGSLISSDEINPYFSTDENRFFRGSAAQLSVGNADFSMFISRNNIDATTEQTADSCGEYVKSLYSAGIHNTNTLLKKKDVLSVTSFGFCFTYDLKNLRAGIIMSGNRFSIPLNLKGEEPYRLFDFEGKKNDIYTIYYSSITGNILTFGELSLNNAERYAIVEGASFRPSDRLTLNFLYRNYQQGFSTFFGLGPGAGSKTSNERGMLGNFTFEAARHLFISGGYDIQHYDWLRYRCDAPSRGIKKELSVRFLPSENISFYASYSYRMNMINNSDITWIRVQDELKSRNIKFSVQYSKHNISLQTQILYRNVKPENSKGYLINQEIEYKLQSIPVTVWAGYCIFNTDSWNSRIYIYEDDLLYSYSIPALSGKGSRNYLMMKWKISRFAEVRLKYGVTTLVTTGNSMTNTDEIKMQFRLWF